MDITNNILPAICISFWHVGAKYITPMIIADNIKMRMRPKDVYSFLFFILFAITKETEQVHKQIYEVKV